MRSTANARVAGVWEVKSLRFRLVFALPDVTSAKTFFYCQCFGSDSEKFTCLRRSAHEKPLWALSGMGKVELSSVPVGK